MSNNINSNEEESPQTGIKFHLIESYLLTISQYINVRLVFFAKRSKPKHKILVLQKKGKETKEEKQEKIV